MRVKASQKDGTEYAGRSNTWEGGMQVRGKSEIQRNEAAFLRQHTRALLSKTIQLYAQHSSFKEDIKVLTQIFSPSFLNIYLL